MARVAYQSSLEVIDELLSVAEQRGTIHLATEVDVAPGTHLRISGRDLVDFGTCGYLALEQDERVRRGAIDAVERFGVQFSVSRSYVTSGTNLELEELRRDIYNGHPTIVYSSTSLCHMSVLPRLVSADEVIVLDQQVHFSVQTAAQLAQQRGAELMMIRHSRMDMLESKLKHLEARHKKIWYLIDGVYSMYGDVAPIEELAQLMDVHPTLYLYIDDAHGMSWYGQHSAGYVFDTLGRRLSERVVLATTLAKGFGTVGASGTKLMLAPNHLGTRPDLVLCHEQSIEKINPATWDALFADAGTHDWDVMRFLEEALRNNERPEENFDFHY